MSRSSCPTPPAEELELESGVTAAAFDPGIRRRTDEDLVRRLRAGGAGAAVEFYERVEPVVTAVLLRVLGRGDRDHEDLAQVALERITQSVLSERFAGRCNLGTWASVVTSRLAIDMLRRRRHERRIFAHEPGEELDTKASPDRDHPDRRADAERRLEALRSALGKISPEKSETVVLFEVMGYELSEVAELTGVSVAAAQTRLVRGRRELAKHITALLGGHHVD